jgi:heptose I phosphotransferase
MTTGTLWMRLTRGARRVLHRPDWPGFAGADFVDSIMSVALTDRHFSKQGRSTGRWVLRRPGQQLVVFLKRHRHAALWQRVFALLWPGGGWSAALAEWRHLHWAKAHGVPVPEPVAAGEFIGPGLRLASFLAVEELTGMLPLHQAIPRAAAELSARRFQCWKRAVSDQMARHARALHDRRRYHKDLYLCHFFVPPAAATSGPWPAGLVHMIDFHRLGHHPLTGWRWRIKDLAALLYSSDVPGVTDRDRLRFFHQYRGVRKLDRAGRRMLRLVLAKAERYRRHNDRSRDSGIRSQKAGGSNQGFVVHGTARSDPSPLTTRQPPATSPPATSPPGDQAA